MKNYIKINLFVISTFIFYSLIYYSISLSQNLGLTEEKKTNHVYEQPIYQDADGNRYSKYFTIMFTEEIFSECDRNSRFKFDNALFKSNTIKQIFENIRKKYGDFEVKFQFPKYKFGINYGWNKRLQKNVEVPDLSQIISFYFEHTVNIEVFKKYLAQFKCIECSHGPVESILTTDPNDTYFGQQHQWYLYNTNTVHGWDITKGNSQTIIDISDIFLTCDLHPDLNSKFVLEISDVGNWGGHGILVAGVAGALTNNGQGIASTGWNVSLAKSSATSYTQMITAADDGVDIINCSWEQPEPYADCKLSVKTLLVRGVIVVGSAANGVLSYDAQHNPIPRVIYPAAYNFGGDTGQVIGVSGTILMQFPDGPEDFIHYWHQGDGFYHYYNFSPGTDPINDPENAFIDVAAPGANITTTQTLGYGQHIISPDSIWGVSLAVPQVSALCGLILSLNNSLTPKQVYGIVTNTADKAGSFSYDANGWNRYLGYGRINVYNALKYTLEHYGGTMTQSITIPYGETWNISPGVTWNFPPGTGLSVYGTLNASGTSGSPIIFTGSGWNGITLYTSSSSMSYCKVTYASTGITVPYGSPSISWTWINNCSTGMYVNGGSPHLSYSTLAYNSSQGLSLNSSAYIDMVDYDGANIITQNGLGININNNSTAYASWGYNSIYSNTPGYLVTTSGDSYMYGVYNYWGYPVQSNWFSGNVVYSAPLATDPNSGRPLTKQMTTPIAENGKLLQKKINQTTSITGDDVHQAYRLFKLKQYKETMDACKLILSKASSSSNTAFSALSILRLAGQELKQSDVETDLQNIVSSNEGNELGGVALLNNAYYLFFKGKYNNALSMLDMAVQKYGNTNIEKVASFNKILALYNYLKDEKKGNAELAGFENKYPGDDLIKDLKQLTKTQDKPEFNVKPSPQVNNVNNPSDDITLSNFPNPFNPSTTIKYNILKDGNVTLKIYDMLGREVKTLVNEYKQAGNYESVLDASKLASGIYYYELLTGGKSITKRMTLMK